jgi:hypothetical protein
MSKIAYSNIADWRALSGSAFGRRTNRAVDTVGGTA